MKYIFSLTERDPVRRREMARSEKLRFITIEKKQRKNNARILHILFYGVIVSTYLNGKN